MQEDPRKMIDWTRVGASFEMKVGREDLLDIADIPFLEYEKEHTYSQRWPKPIDAAAGWGGAAALPDSSLFPERRIQLNMGFGTLGATMHRS